MRHILCAAVALLLPNLWAQSPLAKPRFEVASVKPAAGEQTGGLEEKFREMQRIARRPGQIPMDDPGRVRLRNWALLDLIAAAYRVRATEVSGPAWLSEQIFDIEANTPDGASKEELNAMLQSLLEERFGLKVHRDTRTGEGYALAVGKNGPNLKPADPPPDSPAGLTEEEQRARVRQQAQARMEAMRQSMQENRESATPKVGISRANFPSIAMEDLALQLARFAGAPVADETGLTGKYAVTIETWKNSDLPGGTIFDAVERLGLKLEARKISVETVIVDRVSKTPTAN